MERPLASALQQLRDDIAQIKAAGYVSVEFRQWHASVLKNLCDAVGEESDEYKSFRQLRFEVSPEADQSFGQQLESLGLDSLREGIQARQFEKAMQQASDLLQTVIWVLAKRSG